MAHSTDLYCPECLEESNEENQVITRRLSLDKYILLCNKCSFTKLCEGEASLTRDEVIKYGLPGEILDHMSLKLQDIQPILLLALHEYLLSMQEPRLPEDNLLSYIEDILNESVHNDASVEQLILLPGTSNTYATQNFENLLLVVSHKYKESMAPKIKKAVLKAFAKIPKLNFPDDVIVNYML